MSLPAKDVYDRILSQVSKQGSLPIDFIMYDADSLCEPRWNPSLAIARCEVGLHPGLPTNLHFWAAGLRAFMVGRDRESHFVETAICGLCSPVPKDAWRQSVDSILTRATAPPDIGIDSDTTGVYRMFDDGNRRSLMIESRRHFVAIYWENDTAPPASTPLILALRDKAAQVFGQVPEEHWVATQHHTRISDPQDVVYCWKIGNEEIREIDWVGAEDEVQLCFALSTQSDQVEFAWGGAAGGARRASYWVRGEEAAIHLMNTAEVVVADAD